MILKLPWPPSVNHYYSVFRGRKILSREGRSYRSLVWYRMRRSNVEAIEGPLAVAIDLYPPDARRRDVDNVLKALLDSLQHGGAYLDDNQIAKLTIQKREKKRGGRVVVEIVGIEDAVVREACSEVDS